MNLLNFIEQYPDESSCQAQFKAYRDRIGVLCSKCGGNKQYWKKDKEQYQCISCGYRQCLRSNSVMHGSQLPFRYWFIAVYLLSSTRKVFSALEVQRQFRHPYYEPIWEMGHKLRSVMAESQPLEDKKEDKGKGKGKKNRKVGYLKMRVVDELKAGTVQGVGSLEVDLESEIDSDDSTSYKRLEKMVAARRPKVIPKQEIGKTLSWAHIAISNTRSLFLDIYHDINGKYLQNYLNEFCYKFNRRFSGENLFYRLLVAAVSYKNHFRYNIR